MRGSTIVREVRQLSCLPLRRDTVCHLVLVPHAVEAPSLNRLLAADPALALAGLRRVPPALARTGLGIAQVARAVRAGELYELARSAAGCEATTAGRAAGDRLWAHSIATAHAARALARARGYKHPELAFLAGLLHNLGLLAVAAVAGDVAAELLASAASPAALLAAEEKGLGTTHGQIGRELADRWRLPAWLQDAACWHHQPPDALPASARYRALVELVHAADEAVAAGDFALHRPVEPDAWRLPWQQNGNTLAATVSRGVRQSHAFLRSHSMGAAADEAAQPIVAHMAELAAQQAFLQADLDWRRHAWARWCELPPGAGPTELTGLVAEAFCASTAALAAVCYVRNADGSAAEGTLWSDAPRPVSCSLELGGGSPSHAEQVIAQLRPVWRNRSYRAIDLEDGGESLGHVLLWFDDYGPVGGELSVGGASALATAWLKHAAHAARLEGQQAELSAALREQAVRADARLEAAKMAGLAEMAAGAGHEINNPLAVISGRAQLLMSEETEPRRRKALKTITAQVERIHRMIVDLMLFARPPAPALKPVALGDAVDRAVAAVKADAEERKITVTAAIPADLPLVSADIDQLASAIGSIVRNSLEAIEAEGAVRITAQPADECRVELRISDTGPGISDPQRAHIFEPFFSGRDAGRGLGMGLPKAWRVVQNHQGEIAVEPAPTGATLVIRLPQLSPAAADQRACA